MSTEAGVRILEATGGPRAKCPECGNELLGTGTIGHNDDGSHSYTPEPCPDCQHDHGGYTVCNTAGPMPGDGPCGCTTDPRPAKRVETEAGRVLLERVAAMVKRLPSTAGIVASADIRAIEAEAGELDRAWAACEAALPEGWSLAGLHSDPKGGWFCFALDGADRYEEADGPTPTLALQALTLALRDKAAGR